MSDKPKDILYYLGPIIIIVIIVGGSICIAMMTAKPYSDIPSITFDNAKMSFNYKNEKMEEVSLNNPIIAIVSISNNSEVLCAFYRKEDKYEENNEYELNQIMVISKLHESGNSKEISEKYKAQFGEKDFLILSEKNRTINGSTAYQINYRGFYPGPSENYEIYTKYMTIIIFENKGNLYQIVYWSVDSPEKNYFSNKDFNYILDTLKIK